MELDPSSWTGSTSNLGAKYAAAANYSLSRQEPTFDFRKRTTSQALSFDGDALWTAPVSVGTPPQIFEMYFDTASSDFSLPTASCIDASCDGKARYNWSASATANATSFDVASVWTDGTSGTGLLIRDTVTIGSSKVVNQDIVAQQSTGWFVSNRNADGVGLAFPDTSAARSRSFPFTLSNQKSAKTFSMRLSRVPGKSRIFFEGLDRSLAASVPTFFPVARDPDEEFKTYWQIGQSTAFVDGNQAYSGRANFILDSGTSVIVAPPDAASEFWSAINGSRVETSGYYSYPCEQFRLVEFNFGGSDKMFAISLEDFNLGHLESDSTRCLGALVGQNLNLWDSWVVGDVFFKSWLLTFASCPSPRPSRIGITTPLSA
ncbi:hypothetical protein JCM11491_004859 [Sporobolomyces phaffii]